MSNALAIATTTAALQQHIATLINPYFPGLKITIGQPRAPAQTDVSPEIIITLYLAAPNLAYRNVDLPTRHADGKTTTAINQPCIGLDLYYLFSFYGDTQKLDSQCLLGSLIQSIHARPIITADIVESAINSSIYKDLLGNNKSDLASQMTLPNLPYEPIRLTLHSVTVKDITELWSAFFQTIPYSLSIAYRASTVLINANEIIELKSAVKQVQITVTDSLQ